MKNRAFLNVVFLCFLGLALVIARDVATTASAQQLQVSADLLRAFAPLPAAFENPDNPLTEAKINLGRMLYYDQRLSIDQDISCNTCHDLARYGIDLESPSAGHRGQFGSRDAPTVYNAAGQVAQFWDGRARDVEEQAVGPILNPVEMAMPNPAYVLKVLKSIPEYVAAFKEAFPGEANPVTYPNIGKAIGAFERKLVTPSRWDSFLAGGQNELTDDEKRGLLVFVQAGCATCHNGALVGGNSFERLGVIKPWPDSRDLGRFTQTRNEGDRLVFKVPLLRNIEKTGPYFHNGKVKKLAEAVQLMSTYQVVRALSEDEIMAVIAWLNTLTGAIPENYISKPRLPPSGPNTPQPARGPGD